MTSLGSVCEVGPAPRTTTCVRSTDSTIHGGDRHVVAAFPMRKAECGVTTIRQGPFGLANR